MVFSKLTSLLAVLALAASTVSASDVRPRIHPSVHRTLRQQNTVNLILTLRKGTESALNAAKESGFATKGQRIASLVESLELNAKESTKEVAALLAQESAGSLFTRSETFWITNEVFIENASIELLEKLATLTSVSDIREEEVFTLQPIAARQIRPLAVANTTATPEWGVSRIGAPSVWAAGFTGQGVVVGHIDSGARATHQDLRGNFRSTYSWFDPESRRATPYDNNGHGTHTIGTIVGANGVGVAPGATWISCKGCRSSSCPESDLLSCGQFMTCPTTPQGTGRDCTKAPDLVSNSWGGGQGSTSYKRVVDAWQAAGIIPIFAQGNSGRTGCRTANSPGDLPNVIGVGATDINDALASFSSKGPAVTGILKPDLSGPGVNVRSTWITNDASYNAISGTSMATPHVAGAVALLLSARPSLTYTQVRSALTSTAFTRLSATGYTCGNTPDSTIPNNQFGAGRINALAAFNQVRA